jgi:mono/diheme cytochrome c family protein
MTEVEGFWSGPGGGAGRFEAHSGQSAALTSMAQRATASKTDMNKRWIGAGGAMLLAAGLCGYALGVRVARAAETAAPAAAADAVAQVSHGKSLFVSYGCGWCHEDGGRKAGKCPQLMNTQRDDNVILTRIDTGSEGKMPAFGTTLTGPDLQALLTYIHSLKPETNQ